MVPVLVPMLLGPLELGLDWWTRTTLQSVANVTARCVAISNPVLHDHEHAGDVCCEPGEEAGRPMRLSPLPTSRSPRQRRATARPAPSKRSVAIINGATCSTARLPAQASTLPLAIRREPCNSSSFLVSRN